MTAGSSRGVDSPPWKSALKETLLANYAKVYIQFARGVLDDLLRVDGDISPALQAAIDQELVQKTRQYLEVRPGGNPCPFRARKRTTSIRTGRRQLRQKQYASVQ